MPRPKGIPNELKKYALTIVPVLELNKSVEELNDCFTTIANKYSFEVIDQAMEYKKDGTPHIHAYVITQRSLFIKADDFRGWSIRIEPVYDLEGWIKYLKKHAKGEKCFDPNKVNPLDYMFIDED